MSFPIKNGGSFHSYVSLPEGTDLGDAGRWFQDGSKPLDKKASPSSTLRLLSIAIPCRDLRPMPQSARQAVNQRTRLALRPKANLRAVAHQRHLLENFLDMPAHQNQVSPFAMISTSHTDARKPSQANVVARAPTYAASVDVVCIYIYISSNSLGPILYIYTEEYSHYNHSILNSIIYPM